MDNQPRCNWTPLVIRPRLLALSVFHALLGGQVQAATFVVDNLADDGDGCTLREAIASIASGPAPGCSLVAGDDVVEFDSSLQGETITLSQGRLDLASSITIAGPGAGLLTVSGNNSAQIFSISDSNPTTTFTATISGLTLTGGSAAVSGGAVFNDEDVTLLDCVLTGNSAGSGGAVFNRFGAVNLVDSTLSGNTAAFGGGIHNGGSLNLTNVDLSDNSAISGGGLYSSGTVSVTDGTLSGNGADSGGGIFNVSSGTLSVFSTSLSSNSASIGGAIYNAGTATIGSSTLSANSGYQGGGIHNRAGTLTVTNSVISDHTQGGRGGGIHVFEGKATIVLSTLTGNSVFNDGGGIYQDRGTLRVNQTTFDSNTARIGGGLSTRGLGSFGPTDARITNSSFVNNTATYRGGGLYSSNNDQLVVFNSTFSGNQAELYGGGMELAGGGTATLINATITGNSAGIYGGGLANGIMSITDIVNTIVANSVSGGDCVAVDDDDLEHINDLIEDGGCPPPVGNPTLNLDPQLGPLADNGGPTLTHALLPSSPAIDGGDNDSCSLSDPPQDQRGALRSVDGDNDGLIVCDIGAVEFGSDPPPDEIFSDGFE